MRKYFSALLLVLCVSCQNIPRNDSTAAAPESPILGILNKGKYIEAFRLLPEHMKEWSEYTSKTGNTAEGSAGYVYTRVLMTIAEKGEKDWGKIFDDPSIPYPYKTELLFEIGEARLGKGASWHPEGFIFIPSQKKMDSWNEVDAMLNTYLKEKQ